MPTTLEIQVCEVFEVNVFKPQVFLIVHSIKECKKVYSRPVTYTVLFSRPPNDIVVASPISKAYHESGVLF